jgi:hypothetical protein
MLCEAERTYAAAFLVLAFLVGFFVAAFLAAGFLVAGFLDVAFFVMYESTHVLVFAKHHYTKRHAQHSTHRLFLGSSLLLRRGLFWSGLLFRSLLGLSGTLLALSLNLYEPFT